VQAVQEVEVEVEVKEGDVKLVAHFFFSKIVLRMAMIAAIACSII